MPKVRGAFTRTSPLGSRNRSRGQFGLRFVDGTQHVLDAREERSTFIGKRQATSRPLKQAHAESLFQVADVARHGRLRKTSYVLAAATKLPASTTAAKLLISWILLMKIVPKNVTINPERPYLSQKTYAITSSPWFYMRHKA